MKTSASPTRGAKAVFMGLALAATLTQLACTSSPSAQLPRVPPTPGALTAPELQGIGRAQSLLVRDGKLYIGGTKGLAALDEKGFVLWTTELPEADARGLDVDGDQVAYSSFRVVGHEAGRGLAGALMWGDPSRKLVVDHADVGVVRRGDGKPVWTVKLDESTGLSPPALGNGAVVVQGAKFALVYDRATGKPLSNVPMFTNVLGLSEAWNSRLPVMRPVWMDDSIFTAHQMWMKKLNARGEEVVATKSLGKNFTMLTSGPLLCKGKVLLSEAAYPIGNVFTGKKARVYAANAKGESAWYAETPDEAWGTSDLVCLDDSVIAVSNAMVTAFSHDGKQQWTFASRGGVLTPGSHRGILRTGNGGMPIAHQITAGRQAVAAGSHLYVTSRGAPGKDVLTVFNVKTGEPVEQIDVATMVADMAVFGSDLALTTTEGLKFIALKK